MLYQLLYPESYNSKLFIYLKEDLEKVSNYHINSPEDYEKALSALEKLTRYLWQPKQISSVRKKEKIQEITV